MFSGHRYFVKRYILEMLKQRRRGYGLNFLQLVRHYPGWFSAVSEIVSAVGDRRPWITFSAIDFLGGYLRRDMKVFEYGIGGSTLFFLDRVESVVSIEHDEQWIRNLSSSMTEDELSRWSCSFMEPEERSRNTLQAPSSEMPDYRSSAPEYAGRTFQKYVTSIDDFPDKSFDLIMIDGRARPSCFVHAIRKVKEGCYIFWDNTERENYHATMEAVPSFMEMIDFPGPSPYVDFFTRTTAWKRNG